MAAICVVVDNKNLEHLLTVSDGASGSLPLTTLSTDQNCARIEVFFTDSGGNRKLYSLVIDNIASEKPEMDVRGWIRAGLLHLEFDLQGKTCHRKTIRLGQRKSGQWWMLLPALLIIAGIGLLFLPETTAGTTPEKPVAIAAKLSAPDMPAPATQEVPAVEGITESVYFLPDDASLTGDTKSQLDSLIPRLVGYRSWTVTGHCALAGTERGRIDLSIQRAHAVLDYLLSIGWAPAEAPTVTGLGGNDPVTRDPERQRLNRRVDISSVEGTER